MKRVSRAEPRPEQAIEYMLIAAALVLAMLVSLIGFGGRLAGILHEAARVMGW